MADRLRGSHQRGQTTAWTGSQPVQGGCRNQALGRPRGDCRQPGQHQPRHGQAAQPIIPIPIPLTSHLAGGDLPAGPRAPLRCTVVRKRLFAPESSYTIANLEMQLGIALFDRERTRKPVLTEAGAAILARARAVSGGIDDLRPTAKGLLSGLEAAVTLVVDVMMPTSRLVDAVQAFESAFPTVTLRLHVEALGAVAQLVLAGTRRIW